MHIQPYLFFNGRLDDAIAFYKDALGAEVQMLLRYKDSPEPPPPGAVAPNWDDKIMHSCLKIGETSVFASDGCGTLATGFNGFGLSIAVKDEAEADRVFAALADGGEIRMPLGKTFFSPRFGMVVDRFGVLWMVVIPQ
ncbi:VOC family protein [Methylosinus sp. Sm6]|uniref:VOC family protein n=1 Tax=Methylosinus sp. Sm6 TaxID=2866948 RepID=UPI001C996BC1|nr:VOC family protein [Methylosinus sp. Sm6]MBY6243582.1 VOC family protein [Methylosinus sp. Sm6]